MSKTAIIQDDTDIREKVSEIEQNNWDERAKVFLRYLFKNRPYFRKWWPVMLILLLCTFVENILSSFGAYNYILRISEAFINPNYIKPIVISLVVLIEVLKQLTGVSFFRKAFSVKFDWFVFAALLAITAISMLSTKKGTESYVYKNITAPTLINVDSINKSYNDKIAVIDKDVNYYQEKASKQRDNWTILNKTIPQLNKDRSKFEETRESKIIEASIINDSLLIAANFVTTETAFKVGTGVWMYNLIALLLQGILGFMLVKAARNYEVIDDPKKAAKIETNAEVKEEVSAVKPEPKAKSIELESIVPKRAIGYFHNISETPETLETTKIQALSVSVSTSREEIAAQIKSYERSIKSYEWKIRNGVGKKTTAQKNISDFKEKIKELKSKT